MTLSALIGLSLLITRLTLGAEGNMANADHVISSLGLTVISIAAAELARPVRYLNILLGAALFATPFAFDADPAATIMSIVSGIALIGLSIRCGPIKERYGNWNSPIV